MATHLNLFIDKGSTFKHTIDVEKTTGYAWGQISVWDYTVKGQLRKSYTSTTATDFRITFDTPNKALDVSLTAPQTNALKAGRYVYDIELTEAVFYDANGVQIWPMVDDVVGGTPADPEVTRVLEGQITVNERVTS